MALLKEQSAFLAAFVLNGTITHAAEAVGVDRRNHYHWLEQEEYAAAWAEAQEAAADRLEKEAIRRAVDGLKRFKFTSKGDPILDPDTGKPYYELEYSDRLLECLLRANRPRRFASRHEVTGADGGPLSVNHTLGGLVVENQELSDGLCDALEQAIERERSALAESAGNAS